MTACAWAGWSSGVTEKTVESIDLCIENIRPWTFYEMKTTENAHFTEVCKTLQQIIFFNSMTMSILLIVN